LCRLRGQGGLALVLGLLTQDAKRGEVVLDLLEGCERGLSLVGDGFVVGGERLLGDGAAAARIEERL
jgi:hypothetical protein